MKVEITMEDGTDVLSVCIERSQGERREGVPQLCSVMFDAARGLGCSENDVLIYLRKEIERRWKGLDMLPHWLDAKEATPGKESIIN